MLLVHNLRIVFVAICFCVVLLDLSLPANGKGWDGTR